jgi:hypothetical protein
MLFDQQYTMALEAALSLVEDFGELLEERKIQPRDPKETIKMVENLLKIAVEMSLPHRL